MTTERFTLIREIGEGGLGKVWLARDNDLARDVAIKEIKPGTESSQAARRLIREAQITGQLQHPNIVPVYEVNRGGRPFYAMKLVKGETLSEAIQRHHAQRRTGQADPLSLPRLLNAFVSLCEALADAHSRGVIHRDLKPQNIVLGESGEVIVLDWGLAKVIGEPDDAAAPIALSPDAQADRTRDGATSPRSDATGLELAFAADSAHIATHNVRSAEQLGAPPISPGDFRNLVRPRS
ncbi:MAG: serine/threonine protein kinase [Planctomycetaceae bacterium]|nr:serine/threonine protein kinase [Planctomycetaceae bacterium]